jgi:hypothetical protein
MLSLVLFIFVKMFEFYLKRPSCLVKTVMLLRNLFMNTVDTECGVAQGAIVPLPLARQVSNRSMPGPLVEETETHLQGQDSESL